MADMLAARLAKRRTQLGLFDVPQHSRTDNDVSGLAPIFNYSIYIFSRRFYFDNAL